MAELRAGGRIADVARRHRVQPRTLTWWRWKLRSEADSETALLPVVVRSDQRQRLSGPAVVELSIGDVVIRVAGGTDVEYVAALVEALRG